MELNTKHTLRAWGWTAAPSSAGFAKVALLQVSFVNTVAAEHDGAGNSADCGTGIHCLITGQTELQLPDNCVVGVQNLPASGRRQ